MAELVHLDTSTDSPLGPNESYDSAIDSLPDEACTVAELSYFASRPSLSSMSCSKQSSTLTAPLFDYHRLYRPVPAHSSITRSYSHSTESEPSSLGSAHPLVSTLETTQETVGQRGPECPRMVTSDGVGEWTHPRSPHCQPPPLTQVSTLSNISSSLRSSRSFTTSNRQRPNVTLIRRKSASERLAESKSRYIRCTTDSDQPEEISSVNHPTESMPVLRETPSSTRSSQTSSRVSPFSEPLVASQATYSSNLFQRINNQLSKGRQGQVKRRVSPRLSETSTSNGGTSSLEVQLRELITLDNGPNESCESEVNRERNHIYRAELKYIGSSSSSLSSMFSEPNHSLCSTAAVGVDQHCLASPVTPSDGAQPNQESSAANHANVVVRSKSDVSPAKSKNDGLVRSSDDIERFLESLGLESRPYTQLENETGVEGIQPKSTSHSSNLHNYTTGGSSLSQDSLEKINKYKQTHCIYRNVNDRLSCKSSSTHDLSSLGSHVSLTDQLDNGHSSSRQRKSHSKSTSKLTFENLMLHQRSLASSRSCNNLAVSLYNGPSVVERNARIIKWLFNCRKAMTQTTTLQAGALH